MEEVKGGRHISFIGSREGVGNSYVSMNFAIEMVSRNLRVTYSCCKDDSEKKSFFKYIKDTTGKDSVDIHRTKIEKLSMMTFSGTFDPRYSGNVDGIMSEMCGDTGIFIHNIREPLADPYNILLQNSGIWIITLRIEATAVSDYFALIKKLMMLEKRPTEVYLIFNYTRDIERSFDVYQRILKDTVSLSVEINPYFLGVIQNDLLRQAYAMKLNMPVRGAFPVCGVSGSITFMADKILHKKTITPIPKNGGLLMIDESAV